MRIILQAMNIYNPDSGKHAGVSRSSQKLLEALIEHSEHDYVIIVSCDYQVPELWTSKPNVTIVRQWSKTRLWKWIGQELQAFRYRANVWFSVSGPVPKRGSYPRGSLAHDIFFIKYPETYTEEDRVIHELMYQNITQYSQYIATNSQNTADDLSKQYSLPMDRFIPIPFGIGQTDFDPSDVSPSNLPGTQGRYLFCLSTLEPRKNFIGLLEAYNLLIQDPEFADLELVIAGGKGWKEGGIFTRLKELNLEDRVHFLGYVEDAVVPKLFRQATITVIPSLDEGFGMPLLEAMKFGSVVASSNTGALEEVGGDIPFYFDPRDTQSMLATLKTAIRSDEKESRMERGMERAKQFTWEASANTLLQYFEAKFRKP